MSFAAKAFIALIISLGLAAFGRGFYLGGGHDLVRFFCYLVLASIGSCLKVRLPGFTGTMSLLFLFLLTGIIELSLLETLIIGVVASLVQSFWHAKVRPKPIQIAFSFANISFATAAAELAYHWPIALTPQLQPPLRLAIASSIFFVCNTLPVATVIALTEMKSVGSVWRGCYGWSFPYYLIGAACVGIFSFSDPSFNWQSWLLLAPVVYVIYRSYHQYLERLNAERREAEEQRQHAAEVARLHANAESALAAAVIANAKLDAVIQSSPLAIVGFDQNGKIELWNSAAERMYGWASQDVRGDLVEKSGSQSLGQFREEAAYTLNGESIAGLEVQQVRKDSSTFEAAIWTAPLRTGTSTTGALVTVADISDRKRLEQQLRTSQKMEAVGRLAGGIAHDFNNLLTVINGYGSMLVEQLEDDPHSRYQAEEITQAGRRAAELVSQLLTFSRRQVIKPKLVAVNPLVETLKRMLGRVVGEHIEFKTVLDDQVGLIVADQNQIEGALMNLVINARDAMPEGGTLTLETKHVTIFRNTDVTDLPEGHYVRLVVRDTGKGMDAETQQHLFEPFFTTKEPGKGTGLGLPSVYGSIQQNGGRIFVSTELGKGTAFSIYLPAVDGVDHLQPVQQDIHVLAQGTETILLVEDEAALRRMIREALSHCGYRVWEAANGMEAIERWSSNLDEIDLVVTDIVMPEMNGLKLTEALQKQAPNLKFIYMSGYSDEVLSHQGPTSGDIPFLAKPFLPEALVCKVRYVLDQQVDLQSSKTSSKS